MLIGAGLLMTGLMAVASPLPGLTLPKLEVRTVATSDAVTAPEPTALPRSTTVRVAPAMAAPSATLPAARPAPVQNASALPAVSSLLTLDRPLEHGDYAWNDEGTSGPLWIVVDLKTQFLHAFRGDVEVGRAVILYGADDKPTPTGAFTVTQKKRHHVSNLYGAPMPYMMRLTNDGVAIHASDVEYNAATHGCVGVPDAFAALLFAAAQVGTQVRIVNGGAFAGGAAPTA